MLIIFEPISSASRAISQSSLIRSPFSLLKTQIMATFLQAALRLSSSGVQEITRTLLGEAAGGQPSIWKSWPKEISKMELPAREPGSLLDIGEKALLSVLDKGYINRLALALPDIKELENRDKQLASSNIELSFANACLRGKWLVFVHHTSKWFDTILPAARPSFFVSFGQEANAHSHVHILDFSVYVGRAFVLAFTDAPTEQNIAHATCDVSTNLFSEQLRYNGRWVVSSALHYTDTIKMPLSRCDGITNIWFVRQHVSTLMQHASRISGRVIADTDWSMQQDQVSSEAPGRAFVVWCRQS
jgi:hypothetical protein